MFDKNHLMGNIHLKAEANGDFVQRMQKEQPELAEAVAKLKELLPEEVYQRAFANIQTFNRRGDNLLIVSGGIMQRTFFFGTRLYSCLEGSLKSEKGTNYRLVSVAIIMRCSDVSHLEESINRTS